MNNLDRIIVTEINELFMVSQPKGRFEKVHNRKNYGLSFCIEGQITYTHNGNKTISDKNHATILPQGQTYTLYSNKKGCFPVINFHCTEVLCDTVVSLPIQNFNRYIMDYEQLKALSLFNGNRTKMMSIFYDIWYRLSYQDAENNIITPAISYLENNFDNPELTNTILAQQCNISEVYFRKIFTKQYKITPKKYIVDMRINKAKQLLTEGALKINAIAEHCGFSNQYHFCRTFKEKTGLTPTEYIKQNRIYKI